MCSGDAAHIDGAVSRGEPSSFSPICVEVSRYRMLKLARLGQLSEFNEPDLGEREHAGKGVRLVLYSWSDLGSDPLLRWPDENPYHAQGLG